MRKLRVYVDTSVFGGILDEQFTEASRRFFQDVEKGRFTILLSLLTVEELAAAPEAVRQLVQSFPVGCVEQVAADEEVAALAEAYLEAGILGRAAAMDARHVAAATVARADLLLSWNFKHFVNYERIQKFSGVNILKGYTPLDIRSPQELGDADQDEDV